MRIALILFFQMMFGLSSCVNKKSVEEKINSPNFTNEDLNICLELLPINVKSNYDVHIIRMGSIYRVHGISMVSIKSLNNNRMRVLYSQVSIPFYIKKKQVYQKNYHPIAYSYLIELNVKKNNILKLKNSVFYLPIQVECMISEFFLKAHSEGVTGNLFLVLDDKREKIGMITKYSNGSFQRSIYEIFSKISVPELLQMHSLIPGVKIKRFETKYLDSIQRAGDFPVNVEFD